VEVPGGLHHIHNLSMANILVCFASITDHEKKSHFKKVIGYMGGQFTNSLTDITTHLVTEDVFSKKYFFSAKNNIQIVHPDWIEELWKLNQANGFDMRASDEEYMKKFKLSIFHKVIFCSTGLDNDEKKKLMELIEANGGVYSTTFKSATVKVLLMRKKDLESAKHKAAIKHNIFCLDPKWIHDSIEAGYSLGVEEYKVSKDGALKSSTPTKNSSQLGRFNFDNTVLSEICGDVTTKNVEFEETRRSLMSQKRSALFKPNPSTMNHSIASRASHVSLSPPSEKSNNNNQSAQENKKETTFKKPALPATSTKNENQSRFRLRLKSDKTQENNNDDVIEIPEPLANQNQVDQNWSVASDESFIQILTGKTVCLYGYTQDIESVQVLKECEKFGANLVDLSYGKMIDYVITSSELQEKQPSGIKYKHIVNDYWLEESVEAGRCIDMKFYHHAIFKLPVEEQVLKNEIFVCSNYNTERERPFLRNIVEALGAVYKEALDRLQDAILLCPIAEGKKYDGAIKWNKTVLRAEWIVECYLKKMRADETEFLVGDSKPSAKNVKKRDSIIPFSQGSPALDSPVVRNLRSREVQSPQTPVALSDNEQDEQRVGNISLLVEDMDTPVRNITKSILMEQQKKNKISPRAQRMKDLMKTPSIAATKANVDDYNASPNPDLPIYMKPPADGDYGLQPDATPNTQWHYKRRIDAVDDRFVERSQSKKKAIRDVEQTPPIDVIKYDFFQSRLPNYTSPDPRSSNYNNLQQNKDKLPYVAGNFGNMSTEAKNFLNLEPSQANQESEAYDSEIVKMVEMIKNASDTRPIDNKDNEKETEEKEVQSLLKSKSTSSLKRRKNSIDDGHGRYNNFNLDIVEWSNTQSEARVSSRRQLQMDDDDDNGDDVNILGDIFNVTKATEAAKNKSNMPEKPKTLFAISAPQEVRKLRKK
jgi:hypothetical protein